MNDNDITGRFYSAIVSQNWKHLYPRSRLLLGYIIDSDLKNIT